MILISLLNRYILKNLSLTIIVTTTILTALILLTQSLKFLELIIDAGASSSAFWMLTFLALPRFLEIILPIATMISCLFIYNRMNSDSEIIVLRAAGLSPMKLARPALLMAGIVTLILIFISTWAAPASLSSMQKMRTLLKTQYSTLLFRDGVFNTIGRDLTIYVHNRTQAGELEGLLIHDGRSKTKPPMTIIAERGVLVLSDEGQQVLVYEGSRQDFNPKTGALNRLDFDRYSVDFPETNMVKFKWKEPDERTLLELLNPDINNKRDVENQRSFEVEIHRRLVGPFLTFGFTFIALGFLLLGPTNRRGQGKRIALAILSITILQGLYLSVLNVADKKIIGLIAMYLIVFLPSAIGLFILSRFGEHTRRKLMFKPKGAQLA